MNHTQSPAFIFFGTSSVSVTTLETLAKHGLVPAAIITSPDAPKGRKLTLTPPLTKVYGDAHNIPVLQFAKLDDVAIEEIKKVTAQADARFFLVASYGLIIPQAVLDITSFGAINIHPSLLPQYRGATPMPQAILDDNAQTGITLMLMDAKMDHGPILLQEKRKDPTDWPKPLSKLEDELIMQAAESLVQNLPDILSGKIIPQEQNHELATFTKKIQKTDGFIDITKLSGAEGRKQFLKTQAFEVWPGTYFFIKKQDKEIRIKITEAKWNETESRMEIIKVIPEGQKEVAYTDFLKRVESFYS